MPVDRQFIAALAHGLELLRCFTSEQPVLTNGALAQMTGMTRSLVSRLTYTLVKCGYLDYDAEARAYRLGFSVLSLQPTALSGTRIVESVMPQMQELAERLGARVLLTVYDNFGLTVVQGVCTNPDIPAPMLVGWRYAISRRAMGRTFLASTSGVEQERVLAHLAQGDSLKSELLHAELHHAVQSYRSRGFCTSLGEGRPGNNSISVALNLPHLGQRLFLSCGGPAQRLTERALNDHVAPLLMRSAAEIERSAPRRPAPRSRALATPH